MRGIDNFGAYRLGRTGFERNLVWESTRLPGQADGDIIERKSIQKRWEGTKQLPFLFIITTTKD